MPLKQSPTRKSLSDIKDKYSPTKNNNNKQNNVFVIGFKFGLMALELKKSLDPNEDAYFKDFLDVLNNDSKISNDMGIIKVAFVRELNKCSITQTKTSGYKAHQFFGIAPQEAESDAEFCKKWADKIIDILNNEIKWKYPKKFKFT
jgi:hypothetical protein